MICHGDDIFLFVVWLARHQPVVLTDLPYIWAQWGAWRDDVQNTRNWIGFLLLLVYLFISWPDDSRCPVKISIHLFAVVLGEIVWKDIGNV